MVTSRANLIPALVVAFVVCILAYNNARVTPKHYLSRQSLVHPNFSPWRRLLNYGDEGSFIEMTGFNFDGFTELVTSVAALDELHTGPRGAGFQIQRTSKSTTS